MKRYILLFCFLILCAGSLFFSSATFVNAEIAPKWYCTFFISAVMIIAYIVSSYFPSKRLSFTKIVTGSFLIITILCMLQAGYGILQYTGIFRGNNGFAVTGSFDNPAGFAACLCAGFPCLFYIIFNKQLGLKYLVFAAMLIVVTAVILSMSRAGLFSLAVTAITVTFYRFKINNKLKMILFLSLVVVLTGLYFMKKDSADGRLLIWRCTWEMIKDKPIQGFGYGGFKANYMNYQAAYFEEHPDSEYAMLADNVNRPFNEYIGLAVNYGLVGLILLFVAGWFIWNSFLRCKNNIQARIAICCLMSIAVFAFFSYPLRYPFVWIMMILSIAIIIYQAKYSIKIPRIISKPLKLLLILSICTTALITYQRMTVEINWCKVARKSLLGKMGQMLPIYKQLHNSLFNNELFLYNYAAELNVAGYYDDSKQIAKACELLLADYDLQMLIADNYEKLKQYEDAKRCYQRAAAMCPVKFMPLYKLFRLYGVIGNEFETWKIAQVISDKPIKVMSPMVTNIKREVQNIINH